MAPWLTLAVRDLAVFAATAVLWTFEGASSTLGLVAGALTAVVGFLAHEWGHAAGARLAGARIAPNAPWALPFLFRFHVGNDRAAFLAMTYGGFVASAVATALTVALVPWDRPSGWIALALTLAGGAATFVLEVPIHNRVLRGEALPESPVYYGGDGD